ncbi:ankyrin repeat domain-containing protein [Pedobacter sp. B4-66]|uniref:ankyrin repeat domain-containing protein n=1 Tax=Pedobacter sp. B4-66 TaxID=2817280 RepID=UPI001BD9850F|nr:ankyrin repeat domain-containing protein [Pedobacter sp. B4-66]
MDTLQELVEHIELHFVEGINASFEKGLSPNDSFKGEPLIYELTSEYTRSPRFKSCVKAFVDHGLEFDDPLLLAVLLDDHIYLEHQLKSSPDAVTKRYTLRCAYTPFYEVTLLHICAEFNHVSCAKTLVSYGADVNVQAGITAEGFGGQTPIFHTVNQNGDQSADMRDYLLSQSADLHITLPGLVWGDGYEWETFIPAINPISYALMGLLPQMHRNPIVIANVVSQLMKQRYNIVYLPKNVPNKYLRE